MKRFAVTAVNIGGGSDFIPKFITIVKSKSQAIDAALNYLMRECDEIEDQSGCKMFIDNVHFYAFDACGMYRIQMNIQAIELDVTFSC